MELLGNLLNQALDIIPAQTGTLFRESSRTKNAVGDYITTFGSSEPISGSFQAIPAEKIVLMGLDIKKTYLMLFTSEDVSTLSRGKRGDQIEFDGLRYQLISEGGWNKIDDWSGILMVRVLNDG